MLSKQTIKVGSFNTINLFLLISVKEFGYIIIFLYLCIIKIIKQKKGKNMQIELTKSIAIDLLKGVKPDYSVMNEIPKDLGDFSGSYGEWHWNNFKEDIPYTTEEIYNLYLTCKNSWK